MSECKDPWRARFARTGAASNFIGAATEECYNLST